MKFFSRKFYFALSLALLPFLLCQCASTGGDLGSGAGSSSSSFNRGALAGATSAPGEYIMLVGGPALWKHETLRRPQDQHDRFWGNFVAASNRRADQLKAQKKLENRQLTYLIYRPSLAARGVDDGKPYAEWAAKNVAKRGGKLVFFDDAQDVISYINNGQSRSSMPIVGLEFFGHSNKHCMMLDYSADIYAASTVFIHENDFRRLSRNAFAPNAFVKSWGCHTAESMSSKFKQATGQTMRGAFGPTSYHALAEGKLPTAPRWNYNFKQ